MLPTEIIDAIDALSDWSIDKHIDDRIAELHAAILTFGDQRYEEGIEAGRELEQTKGEGT